MRWAKRQGHPRYFWPEVAPAAWREALQEIERVAADVLGSRPSSLGTRGVEAARALGLAGYTSGLGPLIGHWIQTGRVDADPLLETLFRLHLDHGRRRAGRLQAELSRAANALAHAGITPLTIKSAHTADEYFPEPGTRPAMDVDLVVPPGHFDLARRTLIDVGYEVAVSSVGPRKLVLLAPESPRLPRSLEMAHADSQYVVDLQESLKRNFFGIRTVDVVPEERIPRASVLQPGTAVRVLRQPGLLLYHALHASHGLYHLTLIRIVELVLMIREDRESGRLDWDGFRELAEERRAWRFIYPALHMAERLAPGTVEPATLNRAESQAPRTMRRVLASLSPALAQPRVGLALDERFMWCATPLDYVRRSVHMVFPPGLVRTPGRVARGYVARFYRLLRRRVSVIRSNDVS